MPGIDDGKPLPWTMFERLDETPDALFYVQPRFVTHIDDVTIAALTSFYSEILFSGADVLDLMSSWVSHLPEEPELGHIAGLGMNAAELDGNPRLGERVVHDLNRDPSLPWDAACFNFVLIAVSIQYLIRPVEVFADIARVLRPGGQVVVSMSHRCFHTKAIRAFHTSGKDERMRVVAEYVRRSGGFDLPDALDRSPANADPLWLVRAARI